MSNSETIKGPFVLWNNYGYDGWQPTNFKTLKEALEAEKSYEWVVTTICEYEVTHTNAQS